MDFDPPLGTDRVFVAIPLPFNRQLSEDDNSFEDNLIKRMLLYINVFYK